jgi:hypothetical protein
VKANRHPGDLPLPRPVLRGQAGTIYRLGRAAGERAARREYWEVYADVMADLAGAEVEPEGGIHPAESDAFAEPLTDVWRPAPCRPTGLRWRPLRGVGDDESLAT